MVPDTRYAKCGDLQIAYQVFGTGPTNLVIAPPFVSNIENFWDEPAFARWLNRLGNFARVAMFDKRGTGLSDRVSELPGLETRMEDFKAVMDAAGFETAAVMGISEGGSLATLFAAMYPQRCEGLVLYGCFARFTSWLPTQEALDAFLGYIDQHWGTGGSLPMFGPTRGDDPAFQQWWGRFERLGASPSAAKALMRMNSQIDVSDILGAVRVPTLVVHRTNDGTINIEGGRFLAENIPGARLVELPGTDHIPFIGENVGEILDAIEEFLTGSKTSVVPDRVLATVLFTDVVGSTERAALLGDQRWRDLLDKHNNIIRRNITRFRGREAKTTGDGFLIVFDGPARAVRCACAISNEIRPLGIQIRAGLHTGECEEIGDDIGGIAVHTGARVAAMAGPGEVLVSSTVKDLVAGSGLRFADRGEHVLKGIPDAWRIFAVEQ
jgi:class 3 adenylate cyclase/pimeloyl-ACP methyl ester carboxylesterase